MSFLAQSKKPEYVPCGALCSLDLIVCYQLICPSCKKSSELTSGGMAMAHMPTPADPPARITAPMLNGGAGAASPLGSRPGEGESLRLMSSYVAK